MTNRKLAARSFPVHALPLIAPFALATLLTSSGSAQMPSRDASLEAVSSRAPLAFIENKGQWPAEIRFRLGRGPLSAAVLQRGFALKLVDMESGRRAQRAVGLGFHFEGGSLANETQPSSVHGAQPTPGLYNFFLGDDARQWRSNVQGWNRVVYPHVWPGIDVVLRDGSGLFEYDLVLEPGADLARAQIRVEGARSIEVDEGGRLVVDTEVGPLVHTAPIAWTEDVAGNRVSHPCAFRQIADNRFGFEADPIPADQRLVVDPGVVWSTFLGDEDEDLTRSVLRAPGGDVVVTGGTYSYDFPMTMGAYDVTLNGNLDAFITRLSSNGDALVYSTFFGGSSSDYGSAVALHADGSVYVGGESLSTNLPTTTGAYKQSSSGLVDGFVAHLDASGASLLHSTYFGSTGYERIMDMALDSNGRPVLVGSTSNGSFPTTPGSFEVSYGGSSTDGFLTRFAGDLSTLEISTFLGGAQTESAECLWIPADGRMIVGGATRSSNFPVTAGALQSTLAGGSGDQDGFLLGLDANGQNLLWSTYLGGTSDDAVYALEVSATGDCVVAGETESPDFPLGVNPVQGTHGGLRDAFLAFIQPVGSATQLLDATFFGGSGDESAEGLVLQSTGQIVIAGTTSSTDLPMEPWVYDDDFGKWPNTGIKDLFLNRYEADHSMSYSTYFGGAGDDTLTDMVDGGEGTVIFGGYTNSYNLPLSLGAFDVSYDFSGAYDGFVSKFEFLRFPFPYGTGKVHSAGGSAQISYSGFPSFAAGSLDLWVDGVLANSTGLFFVSENPGSIPFAGGELLMSPPYQRTPTQTVGWLGSGSLHVNISPSMIGTTRYYQYWFVDSADPYGIGLSSGMEVLFYP